MTAQTTTNPEAPPTERQYTAPELCALTGVSYRRIDHWSRCGLFADQTPGSGYHRAFTERDVELVHAVRHLLDAGFDVRTAFELAREVTANGTATRRHDAYTITVAADYATDLPTEGASTP